MPDLRCCDKAIAKPAPSFGTTTFLKTRHQKGTQKYVKKVVNDCAGGLCSIAQLKYSTCFRTILSGTNNNVTTTLQTVTVKKEPEDISSTSEQAQAQQIQQPQTQTIAVSVAPNQTATHTIVETASNAGANQPQHIMTQHDNSDGSTSLQIAQVQNLPTTHQLTLSNLNQVNFNDAKISEIAHFNAVQPCDNL